MGKQLRRSRHDRWIGGVCGGLGEFLGLNPFWFRLLFFVLALPGGMPGVVPYIILWVVIPLAVPRPHTGSAGGRLEAV